MVTSLRRMPLCDGRGGVAPEKHSEFSESLFHLHPKCEGFLVPPVGHFLDGFPQQMKSPVFKDHFKDEEGKGEDLGGTASERHKHGNSVSLCAK